MSRSDACFEIADHLFLSQIDCVEATDRLRDLARSLTSAEWRAVKGYVRAMSSLTGVHQ